MDWPQDPFDDDAPRDGDEPQAIARPRPNEADTFDSAVGDAWESAYELTWSDAD
jgi:hypothetical protein